MMGYGLERAHRIESLKTDIKWKQSQQEVAKGGENLPQREIQVTKINTY